MNIFVKTKNAPNDLKCKINHTFFFGNRGSQKGGRGGGGPTLGKNSQKIPFFFLTASLKIKSETVLGDVRSKEMSEI